MTIKRGESWGETVDRPGDLRVTADDAALAHLVFTAPDVPVAVSSGDMFTTVGARPLGERTELNRLPIDLMHVTLDAREPVVGVAHVIVRSPWRRGGWWRGPVLAVMNAEHWGQLDVAPRGHPNDGRVETLWGGAALSVRQRLAVGRRLRTGTHLPHPSIEHRSVRAAAWTFDHPMVVAIDGRSQDMARSIRIEVEADGAVLYA